MNTNELKYQLTALIDGQISDPSIENELRRLIDSEPEFRQEYDTLRFTKMLVQKKCTFHSTPDKLRQKIIRQIKPMENETPKFMSLLKDIFSKPSIAISGAMALILIAVILIFNQPSNNEIANLLGEQYGPENMFLQASNNFNSILAGKLAPQILTDNADKVKNFFSANGVKYLTTIPKCENWKILGAVVSEAGGEKFAHHVYANEEGKLVYLFQVDESYLNKNNAIKLSEGMIKYLDEGKCFINTKDSQTTLMKKMQGNICAIVSNAPKTEIENLFCSL